MTIFSVVAGMLFLRERNARIKLETDASLDEKQDAVEAAKEKVNEATSTAEKSGKAYDDAMAEYMRIGHLEAGGSDEPEDL